MQGTLAYNIIVGLIDYAQGNLLIDTCVKMLIILNYNISYKYTQFNTISHTTRFEVWCCHYISHIINHFIYWRAMSDVIVIQVTFMPLILVYEECILHSWRNDCKIHFIMKSNLNLQILVVKLRYISVRPSFWKAYCI